MSDVRSKSEVGKNQMKIQSRKDVLPSGKPGRYKDHKATELHFDGGSSIKLVGSYSPTPSCPPDATPTHWLIFGMDSRRVVLELSHQELLDLRKSIDENLQAFKPRRVK